MLGYFCPECKSRPETAIIVENREVIARQTSDKFLGEYQVVICEACLSHSGKGDLWAYIHPDGGTEIFYLFNRERQYMELAA